MKIARTVGIVLGSLAIAIPCVVLAIVVYLMRQPTPSNDPNQLCVEPGCLQLQHPRGPKKRPNVLRSQTRDGSQQYHRRDAEAGR